MNNKRIMLIGYMGCGKTSVGKELCSLTHGRFIDMDGEIERIEAMTIKKIFMKFGEHEFRNKEAELLDKLCNVTSAIDVMTCGNGAVKKMIERAGKYAEFENIANKEDNGIIVSCGGGIILDDLNCKILSKEFTVLLDGPLEVLFSRIKDESHRPLAFLDTFDESKRFEKFVELYASRQDLYKNTAAFTVDILNAEGKEKTPTEIAEEIFNLMSF